MKKKAIAICKYLNFMNLFKDKSVDTTSLENTLVYRTYQCKTTLLLPHRRALPLSIPI